MSAFEQRVEIPNKSYQYLLFAAEPYETISFKIPNKDIEKSVGPQIPGETKFWTKWDETIKQFSLQLHFKPQVQRLGQITPKPKNRLRSNATEAGSRSRQVKTIHKSNKMKPKLKSDT